ncbi:K02A2.6-like, partial [Pristimantis euphronides]
MEPGKIEAISNWVQPSSLKALQRFLGFANYYRKFIRGFSVIAKPLTDLTVKGANLRDWSPQAIEAFNTLKQRFSEAPILVDCLPPHRRHDCAIELIPDSKLPKSRLFRLSDPEREAMRDYVRDSLRKGHIRPSSSPLVAGFFFVTKKDGGLRPCVDYRGLNNITIRNTYPLPLIPDLFDQVRGARVFSKLDLKGAYNLIRIREGDEWKTAFLTPEGHFECLVMPFGLCNAPSVFQEFVNDLFRSVLGRFVIIYLDDILVFSPDWETHREHLRAVFQILLDNSLYAKREKCEFGVTFIAFLGHILTSDAITMDPAKVKAVLDWVQPSSLKALQRFLGFTNYYRKFNKNVSIIAKPLTDLTIKGSNVTDWSREAVIAFQNLKQAFTS